MTLHVHRSSTEIRAGVNKRLKQVGVMFFGVAVLMFARTALEDAMLRAELPGYALYSEHVRYRLVPGVW